MTAEDRLKIMNEIFERCRGLLRTKGEEYAGREDTLANFKRNAEKLGLTKYQVWGVYAGKHLDAIFNAIKYHPDNPELGFQSEPMLGRIDDAIVYLTILAALAEEDREGTEEPDCNPPSNVPFPGAVFYATAATRASLE